MSLPRNTPVITKDYTEREILKLLHYANEDQANYYADQAERVAHVGHAATWIKAWLLYRSENSVDSEAPRHRAIYSKEPALVRIAAMIKNAT